MASAGTRDAQERDNMKFIFLVITGFALAVSASAQGRGAAPIPVRPQQQTFDTSIGAIKITPLFHASVLIEMPGTATYIDPAKPAPLDGLPDANFILITDI